MLVIADGDGPSGVAGIMGGAASEITDATTRVMLEVHTRGKGICGVFTYEIAETKVAQVTSYSRDNQHPLLCALEEA